MPRGIPNPENAEGCLLLPFQPGFWGMAFWFTVLIFLINGAVRLSETGVPPIVSAWNYLAHGWGSLESIWSWLPLIILGVLLITFLIICVRWPGVIFLVNFQLSCLTPLRYKNLYFSSLISLINIPY